MHRGPFTKDRGTLVIDSGGVAFQSRGKRSQHWAFLDIYSFVLLPHRLTVQTYKPRGWHRPGEQKHEFDLTESIPPTVAAVLANGLRRPSQNAVPDPQSPAIAAIAVRHRKLGGGTNGILRFRNDGIDYVTDTPGDSRSWRWADLQTLSDPDPYRLLVFGYRDTYTFDLKEPLPRTVLGQAANSISVSTVTDSVGTPATAAPSRMKNIPVGGDERSNN